MGINLERTHISPHNTRAMHGMKPSAMAMARASRLRALRERVHKEMSQRHFAARLGVSQARYNHWENGWPIPSDQIRKLKDITPGLTADWLLWGETAFMSPLLMKLLMEEPPKDQH